MGAFSILGVKYDTLNYFITFFHYLAHFEPFLFV